MKYERGSFIVVPSREKLRGMPVPAQALYMWLCSYANETGECFPSIETLKRDCDCSRDTIVRMTKLLVDRDLLKVDKRFKGNEQLTNLYSVVVHIDPPPPTISLPPRTDSLPLPAQSATELNPVLTESTKEGVAPLRVVSESSEKENTDAPEKTRDGYQDGYKELCEWAEKRRGAKFINRGKQYTHLKRARVNKINPSQLKKRWIELEADDWRDGLDWASVVSSFDKRPAK